MSPLNIVRGFSSVVVVILMAMPAVSHAQTCASNADCARGRSCQVSTIPTKPAPVPLPSCAKGVPCEGSLISPAPVQSEMSCQAAPCQLDADCGTGMICHSETLSSCSGGTARACPANAICDPLPAPTPITCTETTISSCAYPWQLPCMVDSDCGTQFTCKPFTSGTCSGGVGVGVGIPGGTSTGGTATSTIAPDQVTIAPAAPVGVDGGTASIDGSTTCTTTTTFPGYCQPKSVTCTADTDCPAAWTCVSAPVPLNGGPAPADTGISIIPTPGPGLPAIPAYKICQAPAAFPMRGGSANIAVDGTQFHGMGTKGTGTSAPEAATSSKSAGCSVTGAARPERATLLGSMLIGLLVTGLLGVRRRATRRVR